MKVFPIVLISLFVMAICACYSNSTKASPGEFVPMVLVTGGTFVYGNPLGDGDDQPAYPVVVKSFAIAKMEINQFQYKTIMGKNPSSFKGDSLPVENVTWYDAMEFCNKLSVREGYSPAYTITDTKVSLHETNTGYRLPTEIEWEFAARGGLKSKGYRYAGSNDAAAVAWYKLNSNATTHSVGTKQANELGIYDMSGNVTEWCWDWAGRELETDQSNPPPRVWITLRGECWISNQDELRTTMRYSNIDPTVRYYNIGFRVLLPK